MTIQRKKAKRVPNFRINAYTVAPSHPLGVKPSGNALFESADLTKQAKIKDNLLGRLSRFPEELLMEFISYIDNPRDLHNLGCASRILYAYTYDEEHWRRLFIKEYIRMENESREPNANIYPFECTKWMGSWRKTVLKVEQEALIKSNDLIFSDLLYRPYQCSQIDYLELFSKVIDFERRSSDLGHNLNSDFGIDRFDESEFSLEKFNNDFVNKPFILQCKKNPTRWPKWNLDSLLDKFSKVKFRQEAVKWDLRLYAEYFHNNRDESPLYLFDCNSEAVKTIRKEYSSPKIYNDDLFKLFQENNVNCRPDHRWLIVGPARSGSTFHKDPNQTSAWNAGLTGLKLWVMLPPHVKPPGVSTDANEEEVTSPVGIAEWVISGYYNDSVKLAQEGKCLIGVTFPGECIYVPSGWWHTVINLTDSVAITENFVPLPILPKVLMFFKHKKTQISGFHLKDFVHSVKQFLGNVSDVKDLSTENLKMLNSFIENSKNYHFNNDDCGLHDRVEFETPLFEFFVELIRNSKYEANLNEALEKVNEMENEELKRKILDSHNNVKKSEVWHKLASESKDQFSFGFDTNDM